MMDAENVTENTLGNIITTIIDLWRASTAANKLLIFKTFFSSSAQRNITLLKSGLSSNICIMKPILSYAGNQEFFIVASTTLPDGDQHTQETVRALFENSSSLALTIFHLAET
jgi:hypothetical protein